MFWQLISNDHNGEMTFTSSNTNLTRRPKVGREKAQIEFQQEQLNISLYPSASLLLLPQILILWVKSWDVGEEMWGTFRLLFICVSFLSARSTQCPLCSWLHPKGMLKQNGSSGSNAKLPESTDYSLLRSEVMVSLWWCLSGRKGTACIFG